MNSSATLGSATSTAKAGTDASMCSQNIWDRRPARENRKETRWPALSPGQPLRRKRMSSFRRWKCATCTSAAGQLASRLWDGTCTRRFSSSLRRRKMRKAICMIAVGAIAVGMFAGRAGSQSKTASGFDRLKTLVGEWQGTSPEGEVFTSTHPACFQRDCARRNVPELRGQSDGDALHARWGSPPDNSLLQHGQPAADANGSRQGGAEGVCLFLDWCLESEEPGGGAYAKHDPPDR